MSHIVGLADEQLGEVPDAEEEGNQDGGIVGAELADKHGADECAGADDQDRQAGEDGRRDYQLILPPLVVGVCVAGHVVVVAAAVVVVIERSFLCSGTSSSPVPSSVLLSPWSWACSASCPSGVSGRAVPSGCRVQCNADLPGTLAVVSKRRKRRLSRSSWCRIHHDRHVGTLEPFWVLDRTRHRLFLASTVPSMEPPTRSDAVTGARKAAPF